MSAPANPMGFQGVTATPKYTPIISLIGGAGYGQMPNRVVDGILEDVERGPVGPGLDVEQSQHRVEQVVVRQAACDLWRRQRTSTSPLAATWRDTHTNMGTWV